MENEKIKVACFGEVLWDVLPTERLPGGAPMNVAYHLHQHGIGAAIVTRIGDDDPGRDLKQWFAQKKLNTGYFQVDPVHETGNVYATPDESGNMKYEIAEPVAWDFISAEPPVFSLVENAGYFIYGSLAARSPVSRNTLYELLESSAVKVMDVNLRPPHFSKGSLMEMMAKADVLKLNEEELGLIGSWFSKRSDLKESIIRISDELTIPTIIVTRGTEGALMYKDGRFYDQPVYRVKVADTIGSGDAFLAGVLIKFIEGKSPEESLDYAARLGALVAGKKGGCPNYSIHETKQLTISP